MSKGSALRGEDGVGETTNSTRQARPTSGGGQVRPGASSGAVLLHLLVSAPHAPVQISDSPKALPSGAVRRREV